MKELPELDQYRPNVGMCVINREGLVWLGKRNVSPSDEKRFPHLWQMPQGGMDKGETPTETAFRELYEETGIRSARLLMMTPGWLVYEFPSDHKARKKDRWRGQRQKWALILFEGDDSEIDLKAVPPQEFSDWRWTPLSEISDKIVPFKRGVYDALIDCFTPLVSYIADQEKARRAAPVEL